MRVERTVTIFSNKTERFITEVNIDYVKLESLIQIFKPKSDDPLMYNAYEINQKNSSKILNLLKEIIHFDFDQFSYYVECSQLPPYEFKHTKTNYN